MFGTVLSRDAVAALALLGKSKVVEDAYLAGGSALALYLGHRESIDFDFFTQQEFIASEKESQLSKVGNFIPQSIFGKTLLGTFNSISFSYFYYQYPLIGKLRKFQDVYIASIDDIAAMKLVAICDRGTKKDYIDLFFLAKHQMSFEEIFENYDKKYHLFQTNTFTIIKALSYFHDAESTEMPKMIKDVSWDKVKKFLLSEAKRLADKYIEDK